MTIYLIISSTLALFMRSMDEGKPLHQMKMKWSENCPKRLYKATIGCDECRCLWLSVITMTIYSVNFGIGYIVTTPLVMIFTYLGYRVLQ